MNNQPIPNNPVLAMAYIPWQKLEKVYAPEEALEKGTLFPELDKPFLGGKHHAG